MGILVTDLREYVIIPTLKDIGMYSPVAVELLVGTAAHESLGGRYLRQKNGGPAYGIYQQEKATLEDIWENFLRYRDVLQQQVKVRYPDAERLQWDLRYATVWARLDYYREREPLPSVEDVWGLARYWYRYWCQGCKGTEEQWVRDYLRYVRDVG